VRALLGYVVGPAVMMHLIMSYHIFSGIVAEDIASGDGADDGGMTLAMTFAKLSLTLNGSAALYFLAGEWISPYCPDKRAAARGGHISALSPSADAVDETFRSLAGDIATYDAPQVLSQGARDLGGTATSGKGVGPMTARLEMV